MAATAHDFLRPNVTPINMTGAEARLCEEEILADFERHAAQAQLVDEYVRKHHAGWTSDLYTFWPVVEAFAAEVHPRWEQLKNEGNDALHNGDLERAIQLYTDALAVANKQKGVNAFFDALNTHAEGSAGDQLAGSRADIEPILRRLMPGPIGRHEPNKPTAICLANRASALLEAGRPEEAVADARAACGCCAEYLKGHFRLRQAYLAAEMPEEAALVDAQIRQYQVLVKHEEGGRVNIGFILQHVGWISGSEYVHIYEEPRRYHWLRQACNVSLYNRDAVRDIDAAPYDAPYHPGLRCHMEVFPLEYRPAGSATSCHCIAISMLVAEPRPDEDGCSSRVVQSALPSMDYKYITLPRTVDGTRPCARGSSLSRGDDGELIAARLQAEIEMMPFLTSLSLGSPLSAHADEVRDYLAGKGLLEPRVPGRELDGLDVCYVAGSCVKHRRFGYRGVIIGTADHTCTADDMWCEQMGVDQLRRGRYQPWYHVLVDIRDRPGGQRCYVCHDNIALWFPVGFEEDPLGPISHPDVYRAFTAWDKGRGSYVVPHFI